MRTGTNGAYLNDLWKVGAAHALYIHDGLWYHPLRRFPGALFDRNGYIVFATEGEYRNSPYLSIGKQISIRRPGIAAIPGYVRVTGSDRNTSSPLAPPSVDLDLHESTAAALEGRARLVQHLERERSQSLVRTKKQSVKSPDCEACGFSFRRAYGDKAAEYCEVHHLLPLADLERATKTRIEDLAILCANCHRVVHLRNPPLPLEEV